MVGIAMIPRAMDSLEPVERVMLVEEIIGAEIPDENAEHFDSPLEMVDWLEPRLSNQRPTNRLRQSSENSQRISNGLNWRKACEIFQ
jgi:hypothetical protein